MSVQQLISIVRNEDWLMEALRAVRSLQLPDWYIAAGAIRNTVWNKLHGYPGRNGQNDVDVVYFDDADIDGYREKTSEITLLKQNPSLKWEVVNQARRQFLSNRPQVHSSEESIAYWSETPTCVGARLEDDDLISVCAPHGLDDLMNLVVRPIPQPYQDLDLYRQRVENKAWEKTWPKLHIVLTK